MWNQHDSLLVNVNKLKTYNSVGMCVSQIHWLHMNEKEWRLFSVFILHCNNRPPNLVSQYIAYYDKTHLLASVQLPHLSQMKVCTDLRFLTNVSLFFILSRKASILFLSYFRAYNFSIFFFVSYFRGTVCWELWSLM